MPELRRDPVVGRWVIISTERARRPSDFQHTIVKTDADHCSFCEGNESQTPPEIYAVRKPETATNGTGWELRVVPSKHPVLRIEGNLDRHGAGMYDVMNGIGAHEVIIESPRHIPNLADLEENQIVKILNTYVERITDLQKDPRFKYVLIFKNYGAVAGAGTITHSHSQLIATPVTPKQVKKELEGSKRYFEYKERCVFCDIVRQETKSPEERLVLDIDGFIAICQFASRFPFETWILPKAHSCNFSHMDKELMGNLARVLKLTLLKLKNALLDPPYNYMLHTAPFRRSTKAGYWRTIDMDFHWHIEIIPRLTKVAGFEWGSGFYINPTPPEEAAKYLRKTGVDNA